MSFAARAPVSSSAWPGGSVREVTLRYGTSSLEHRLAVYASSYLQRELRCDRIGLASKRPFPELAIALPHWQHPRADARAFDRLLDKVATDGDFRLVLWSRDWLDGVQSAQELLNRYQRLLPLPQDYQPLPNLAEVLNARRRLTSSRDGVDAWRWLLRLTARPSRALELAALLHDLVAPRLLRGDGAAHGALAPLGVRRADLVEANELASRSELGDGSTPELALLRDARDLCFFSNHSWQFSREHGCVVTRARVRLLLGRMTARAVCLALATRQPLDVSSMMEEALNEQAYAPDSRLRIA